MPASSATAWGWLLASPCGWAARSVAAVGCARVGEVVDKAVATERLAVVRTLASVAGNWAVSTRRACRRVAMGEGTAGATLAEALAVGPASSVPRRLRCRVVWAAVGAVLAGELVPPCSLVVMAAVLVGCLVTVGGVLAGSAKAVAEIANSLSLGAWPLRWRAGSAVSPAARCRSAAAGAVGTTNGWSLPQGPEALAAGVLAVLVTATLATEADEPAEPAATGEAAEAVVSSSAKVPVVAGWACAAGSFVVTSGERECWLAGCDAVAGWLVCAAKTGVVCVAEVAGPAAHWRRPR
jgi:hypothetical protein